MKVKEIMDLVKTEMKEHKITQEEIADKLDSSQGMISNWLNGRFEPQLYNLERLLNAVGYEIKIVKIK